jgi:catechol 2,3-dioxygenase-like lactoylglutathione lyase family enzyme
MPIPRQSPINNNTSPFGSLCGDHVAVRIPDFEHGKQWFVEKLDFRIQQEWMSDSRQHAYLAPSTDDNLHLEIIGGTGSTPRTRYADVKTSLQEAGYHHFCMSVDNIQEAVAELRRRGVTIVEEPFRLEQIGRRIAFFVDPWRNMIELSQVLAK